MVRLLSNEDIASVLTLGQCIDSVYDALSAFAGGNAARRPRIDLISPAAEPGQFARFSTFEGIISGSYYVLRVKPEILHWTERAGRRRLGSFCVSEGNYGGLVLLYATRDAQLLAIMQDNYLTYTRTAALAGLGARYLARRDAVTVGMLGSGGYARSYARALAAVLPLEQIKVFSPTPEHVAAYCVELQREGLPVEASSTPEEAMGGVDVISTCTSSMEPVLYGEHLRPGVFICNVSNRELAPSALERITTVGHLAAQPQPLDLGGFRDTNFGIHFSSMAYVAGQPEERAQLPRGKGTAAGAASRHVACIDWASGEPLGRQRDDEITFLSDLTGDATQGLASGGLNGIQVAGLAGRAYELAQAAGLGTEIPDDIYLQKE